MSVRQVKLMPVLTDSEDDLLGKLSTRFVIYTAYASPFLYYKREGLSVTKKWLADVSTKCCSHQTGVKRRQVIFRIQVGNITFLSMQQPTEKPLIVSLISACRYF